MVSFTELSNYRGSFGLSVQRDLHFEARGPISAYVDAAGKAAVLLRTSLDKLPREALSGRLSRLVLWCQLGKQGVHLRFGPDGAGCNSGSRQRNTIKTPQSALEAPLFMPT